MLAAEALIMKELEVRQGWMPQDLCFFFGRRKQHVVQDQAEAR